MEFEFEVPSRKIGAVEIMVDGCEGGFDVERGVEGTSWVSVHRV